jgi:hypothetical protein
MSGMRPTGLLPLALAAATLVGCQSPSHPRWSAPSASAAANAPQPSSSPAQAALDALDRRTPVPLLPVMANHQKQNMRDHLRVVQEIVTAVAAKDFDAVQGAVGRMGFSEGMGQMCEHMGAGAPGFTEMALRFHHEADEIGEAAKKQDSGAVLAALSRTLGNCTTCHDSYKQEVVDSGAWMALAKPAGGR